jgi:hypothetical protein
VTTIEFVPLARLMISQEKHASLRSQLDHLIAQTEDASNNNNGGGNGEEKR